MRIAGTLLLLGGFLLCVSILSGPLSVRDDGVRPDLLADRRAKEKAAKGRRLVRILLRLIAGESRRH
jgi:hypothetical protein